MLLDPYQNDYLQKELKNNYTIPVVQNYNIQMDSDYTANEGINRSYSTPGHLVSSLARPVLNRMKTIEPVAAGIKLPRSDNEIL